MDNNLVVLTSIKIDYAPDLYKIVDALNRTLKTKDLLFGLALDKEDHSKAIFTIYRT